MSSRSRPPEWDEDWDEAERPRSRGGRRGGGSDGRRRPPPRPARTFGLPVVLAAAVVGLVIGFASNCGGGDTTTVTESVTVPAPEAPAAAGDVAPSGPASRANIALAFLNGSDEVGLAGRRADGARQLGYRNVTAADAPALVDQDQLYFRRGAAARAAQVAEDLGLESPTQLRAGDPILAAADDATVIVVLGPSGAADPGTGTTGTTGGTSTTG